MGANLETGTTGAAGATGVSGAAGASGSQTTSAASAGTPKVLLVNGSPHKRGCTHTALGLVAEALAVDGIATDEFWIRTKPIGGCIDCRACAKRGAGCIFKDDSVQDFLDIAGGYDGFVFGAPVHFAGMAANMKAFLDRAFFSNANDRTERHVDFILKPAAAITTARRAGTTATLEQMDKYLEHQQMPIVPSRYWNEVHGNTPDEVMQDAEGIQVMHVLGHNMAWMIKAFAAADEAGIARPASYGKRISTNFIR